MASTILTIKGFRYEGKIIAEGEHCITLEDNKEGRIRIPYSNISVIKSAGGENE